VTHGRRRADNTWPQGEAGKVRDRSPDQPTFLAFAWERRVVDVISQEPPNRRTGL